MAYKNREDQLAYASLHYQENKSIYRERSKKANKIVRERNKEFISNYLKTHPCIDCENSDIRVLDFDHVRGEKKINIAETINRSWSISRIESEIDKCEIRCANCHRIVTHKRRKLNKILIAQLVEQ